MRLIIFLFIILLNTPCFASTLTAGYTPVTAQGGSTPQLQNASIYDTGTTSGAGNVGINSTNPGQRLDVQGTVRATSYVESNSATATRGGMFNACFNGQGQLVAAAGGC